jgi:hypothetical protein
VIIDVVGVGDVDVDVDGDGDGDVAVVRSAGYRPGTYLTDQTGDMADT